MLPKASLSLDGPLNSKKIIHLLIIFSGSHQVRVVKKY